MEWGRDEALEVVMLWSQVVESSRGVVMRRLKLSWSGVKSWSRDEALSNLEQWSFAGLLDSFYSYKSP